MSNPIEEIAKATARLAEVQQQRIEREKSAQAHEAAARADRLEMTELKKQAAELTTILQHANVRTAVETMMASAQTAQADAEKAKKDAEKARDDAAAAAVKSKAEQDAEKARLAEKEKKLDELIAKVQAELKPAE